MTAQSTAKRAPKRGKKSAAVAESSPVASEAPAPAAPVVVVAALATPALPSTLTLRQVSDTALMLLPAIAGGADVIDASAVLQCDTAGVQLLIAAARSAAARGGTLVLERPSLALVDGATRLGVAGTLGLDQAA
jgi:ABC-type transporter Mla MlaB component